MDVVVLDEGDSRYPAMLPKHLGDSAPASVSICGNADILNRPDKLAIFCSAKCPGELILKTYDFVCSLRDKGVTTVGGFHSPMEQECLRLLLRGTQPVILCPARGIAAMRLRKEWRKPLDEGRLLIASPFGEKQNRMTARLAEKRNDFVATLADTIVVSYASPGGKTERFCQRLIASGKNLITL